MGNTLADSGKGYTAAFNLAGRMSTLTRAGVTTSYSYDGQGRRLRKASSSGTVIFVHDPAGHLLGEYDGTGAALREYVWMGDTPVAMFTPGATATAPPLVYYLHSDHLDTPRVAIDTSGRLRWRWIAEPFGNTAPETNPAGLGNFTQNLRFPGQYADAESGLFYNGFRDYDPATGRYAQSDPIGMVGGINTYAYVEGNPLSGADPTGLKKWDWNGVGNTAVCKYYDSMATQYPKCSYYKAAANICRGNNGLVNSAVNIAITNSWARDKTQDSQATMLEKVRQALVAADKKAREDGKVDCNTDCVYGNDIDKYHDAAFIAAGLSPSFYGGNLWPQGMPPNPVPRDLRNPIRPPGYNFGP